IAAAINQSSANPAPVTDAIRHELAQIQPAVQQVWLNQHRDTPYVDANTIDADAVGRRHLYTTINALMRNSRVVSDAVDQGRLGIVGCQYQLEKGEVVPITAVGQLRINV